MPGVRSAAAHKCCCRRGVCPGGPNAVEVVGAALVAKAAGRGYRRIAADMGRPDSTVRRWLRTVRGRHGQWLYRQGVEHAARLTPEVLGEIAAQPTELGDVLTALAAAALAVGRRRRRSSPNWSLVGILTGGRLLTPAPSGRSTRCLPGTAMPSNLRHREHHRSAP
ncbi:helix-turn-helix domain-containing protein [Amycolatopsis sp. NPDC059090]|uniref:helix-turn-helix domain-containing protein n=1 Tax=Amycolatopsis sp. NPDC059090 TaxID=3346723 RepID=UPI00366F04D5